MPGKAPVRLYVKGAFVGYKRSHANQYERQALISLDGVNSKSEVDFYLGKRVAYVYQASKAVKGSRYRVIWGRVQRAHGNNGLVRCRFRTNLPPKAMGATVRVMLYPSRV
mmetsp:Transcript_26528/g.62262  ORF Transcript_26528/g.62262 Transcript_26528/m.62262 type:complete len:110 (-) Transcript_26528:122-451(-)